MGEHFIFLGWAHGSFIPDGQSTAVTYNNLYVMQPLDAKAGNMIVSGYRAEKLRCATEVWNGLDLKPFDQVEVFFGRNNRVTGVKVVQRYEDKPAK